MARVELERVTKAYPGAPPAVNDRSLGVPDGGFMVLVGPSGSGKSTALRIVAGLEDPTAGESASAAGGQRPGAPGARRRHGVPGLRPVPHLTVQQNLAFGLQLHKVPKPAQHRRVAEAARILALEPFLARKPAALPGGQRQRVAMGRAIVRDPQAFGMDEPLSNLDAKLRVSTRAPLAALHDRLGGHHRVRDPRPGRGDDPGHPGWRCPRTASCSRRTRPSTCSTPPRSCSWRPSSGRRR
jgi:multiple sugar transport system ATP-binding protein